MQTVMDGYEQQDDLPSGISTVAALLIHANVQPRRLTPTISYRTANKDTYRCIHIYDAMRDAPDIGSECTTLRAPLPFEPPRKRKREGCKLEAEH